MTAITVRNIQNNFLFYNTGVDMKPRFGEYGVRTTMNNEDRKELMALRDGAWILYMQYLNMRHSRKPDFSDEAVIKQFPTWTMRKLSNLRRLLIREGWFLQMGGRMNNGQTFLSTYIGKQAVSDVVNKKTIAEQVEMVPNNE